MVDMLRSLRDDTAPPAVPASEAPHEDAVAFSQYSAHQNRICELLLAGGAPPSRELYEARDIHLLHLSDEDLKREYVRQTEAYLDPATPTPLRGMAEMQVIRMGELVNKPQVLRVQQAERVRGQARASAAMEAEGARRNQAEQEAQQRQRQWNEKAFWSLHSSLAQGLRDPEANPQLFQRLCNRHELQLVLMTSSEVSSLTQAQMQAWGTGGLRPYELRGVLHALQRQPPSGKPAQQFLSLLREKVAALPPPSDASPSDAEGDAASAAAPALAAATPAGNEATLADAILLGRNFRL